MVKIKNLSLDYGKEHILDDISLSIAEGECVLFTGKSGSGKSSLINSINGLAVRYDNAETKGEIIIAGKNIKELELYQISMIVSTVFQNPKTYFFNVNTTLELLFYLENIGLTREEMDKRLNEMLEIFPIKNLLDRDIFRLSGGEKQILCIAACYIAGTKIIVMDEPSSNLDIKSIDVLTNMLKILKNKGISIIIAEHRIYYLMDIIDYVFLIDKGKLKEAYSRSEFLELDTRQLKNLGLRGKKLSKLEVPYLKDGGEYQIKELSYKFTDDECLSIKDISFKLGNIYGIIGYNGLGKSTLLRCLIGLEKKSKEEIYFKGEKLSKKGRLKNSSLVMQDVNHQLFTDEVFKELSLGVKNFDEEKAKSILKDLGLDEFIERHPMSLSGGQKQRLAIASIMCKDSTFVYYDEPTSGMDYANMIKISELIKKYRNKDKIIFIVSHDIEFLNEVADEIFKL
ncbi:ABC transporter ATP-binding protein [Anaerococcus sp. HMSC065G05]|uniref:ABC transporter ATP-binding protein n=1 Tax=Anaerococcus sp. HMSC065G05 TaxID=1739356 RepID=UPI0008A3B806|nr:ABC transporter ATP-binding protein [Anaerococcus sp. HMSC065G05]OFJ67995.1 ABC transporter ATP-binding protein [Anaerococcus sp. HMSC065G05]